MYQNLWKPGWPTTTQNIEFDRKMMAAIGHYSDTLNALLRNPLNGD
jgi:hypothetical protein